MIKKIVLLSFIFAFIGCSTRGEFFGAKVVSKYFQKDGAVCAKVIGWQDVQKGTHKKQYCICLLPSPSEITDEDIQQLSELYKTGNPVGVRKAFLVNDSFCQDQ